MTDDGLKKLQPGDKIRIILNPIKAHYPYRQKGFPKEPGNEYTVKRIDEIHYPTPVIITETFDVGQLFPITKGIQYWDKYRNSCFLILDANDIERVV